MRWPTRLMHGDLNRNGAVVYRGPSRLNPLVPIVVVVTGLTDGTGNGKTGDLLQSWILIDGEHPGEAARLGLDEAICGQCRHRRQPDGQWTCYVQMTAPASIAKCLARGGYPDVSGDLRAVAAVAADRGVRLGSYGDPAAAPFEVWGALLARRRSGRSVTGYTHQRSHPAFDERLLAFAMVSADSLEESWATTMDGHRAFYVRPVGADLPAGMAQCPAAEEAGRRAQCADCALCGGDSVAARPISIEAHGSSRAFVADLDAGLAEVA